MNIILANDDGITAEGLHVLAKALKQIPDTKIYVFGPSENKTAASMSLTISKPIHVEKYDFQYADEAYCIEGTPVDCVRYGAFYLRSRGIEPDLVCSGINHGANVGGDCYFSGTVGAATQGIMVDIPAIAFSLCTHQPAEEQFDIFYELVPKIVNAAYGNIPRFMVLNVNVPPCPREELKGIKVCRPGRHYYEERYLDTGDGNWQIALADVGSQYSGQESDQDMDTVAMLNKYITIGPYCIRQILPGSIDLIKSWNISL